VFLIQTTKWRPPAQTTDASAVILYALLGLAMAFGVLKPRFPTKSLWHLFFSFLLVRRQD
jgi:hypothetical protein